MESNYKFKKIDVKIRACYYFDDIIKIEDFHPDNILNWKITRKYFGL